MKDKLDDTQIEHSPFRTNLSAHLKRGGIALAIAAIIFLLGFVPMWYQARVRTRERDAAQHDLRLAQLQNGLAAATIDARRGDYEPARQEVSKFFSTLRSEVDVRDGSILNTEQIGKLNPIFANRDEVITLLARNDPAAADRLSDMFVAYRKVVGSITP
jgi:hypothetical protein